MQSPQLSITFFSVKCLHVFYYFAISFCLVNPFLSLSSPPCLSSSNLFPFLLQLPLLCSLLYLHVSFLPPSVLYRLTNERVKVQLANPLCASHHCPPLRSLLSPLSSLSVPRPLSVAPLLMFFSSDTASMGKECFCPSYLSSITEWQRTTTDHKPLLQLALSLFSLSHVPLLIFTTLLFVPIFPPPNYISLFFYSTHPTCLPILYLVSNKTYMHITSKKKKKWVQQFCLQLGFRWATGMQISVGNANIIYIVCIIIVYDGKNAKLICTLS